MPLNKTCSIKAFKDNISAEIKAGKSKDQAVAIAYTILKDACGVENDNNMTSEEIVNYNKKENNMGTKIKRISIPINQKDIKVKYGFYTNNNGEKIKLKPGEEITVISKE